MLRKNKNGFVWKKYIQNKIFEVELRDAIRRGVNNYVGKRQLETDKQDYNILVARTRGRLNGLQDSETKKLLRYFKGVLSSRYPQLAKAGKSMTIIKMIGISMLNVYNLKGSKC